MQGVEIDKRIHRAIESNILYMLKARRKEGRVINSCRRMSRSTAAVVKDDKDDVDDDSNE